MIPTFTKTDFDVFQIPGLEARMSALIEHVRPKLTQLGQQMVPYLSTLCGEEMYAHVAKHARRTVNPPDDTWVAWANHKRGYKALPHFQVGLWGTHVFVQFAMIYECRNKQTFATALEKTRNLFEPLKQAEYYWSLDHTTPKVRNIQELTDEMVETIIHRLRIQKQAEFMCGVQLYPEHVALQDGDSLTTFLEQTFKDLLPVYQLAHRSFEN